MDTKIFILFITWNFCIQGLTCQLCSNTDFGENNPSSKDDDIDSGTGIGYIMSESNYIIDCCGIVDRWEANFDNVAGSRTVYFQVWRPVSGGTYELVGENSFTVSSNGEHSTSIAQSNRITIKSGDKFGWWTSGADIITYKSGGGEEDDNWLLSIADLNTGDTQDWSGATVHNDRSYAIRMDVLPNNDPSFTNLPASTTILNSVSSGVSLFTVAVDDIDTYDVSSLSVTMTANSQFSFDTSTLILSTSTITSTGSTERLVFVVTDQCSNSATATYTVTIVNEPPTIHNLPSSTSLSEDTTAETLLYTINVTDTGDTVTCSKASSVPASYPFLVKQIPSSTDYGIYSSSTPGFDYNTLNIYPLTIDCTDTVNTVSGSFTVYLVQNSAPVIVNLQNSTSITTSSTVGSTAFTVIANDAEGDTLSYSMTCSPTPCPFQIFASGAILVTEDLSQHTTVGYDLFITVSDSRNSDGPETLTITIADINDPVLISNLPLASALSVSENTALGTSVYTVSYSDLDTSQTITFSMTSSPTEGASYFSIDSSTGLVTTSGSVTNYETLGSTSFTFGVSVRDPVTSDTQNLVIDIINVNEAPVFSPTSYSISANESVAGASVGSPSYGIMDPDTGDSATYTMDCGASSSYFLKNTVSGAVTFQSDYDLDSGSLPSTVTCTVTATDTGGLTSTATLTINIANINDNTPIFVPTVYTFYVGYYDTVGTTVGTLTASDGDSGTYGTLTYTLDQSSLGAAYFAVDNSGVISLATAPAGSSALNYSTSSIITATATDAGGLTATATVTIVVSDTTTTSSTTTTNSYKKFFDDPYNWAWFVPCMIITIATLFTTCWVVYTCRGDKGCEAFASKLCKRKLMKARLHARRRSFPGRYRRNDFLDFEGTSTETSVRKAPPPVEMQAWRGQRN